VLVARRKAAYLPFMSAVELMKQVKSLPAPEREKFLWAMLMLVDEPAVRPETKAKRVKWPDVEARARRIFGDRTLPNLVLLQREQAVF